MALVSEGRTTLSRFARRDKVEDLRTRRRTCKDFYSPSNGLTNRVIAISKGMIESFDAMHSSSACLQMRFPAAYLTGEIGISAAIDRIGAVPYAAGDAPVLHGERPPASRLERRVCGRPVSICQSSPPEVRDSGGCSARPSTIAPSSMFVARRRVGSASGQDVTVRSGMALARQAYVRRPIAAPPRTPVDHDRSPKALRNGRHNPAHDPHLEAVRGPRHGQSGDDVDHGTSLLG
ncbi:hypothetical protein ACVW1C_006004 [Bradyrhizobium sp. USDA 4011]